MPKLQDLLARITRPFAQAPARQDHAENAPRNLRNTISSAGSFFGFYGRPRDATRFLPTPFNPDDLVQRKGIRTYRKMMQDEQIKAALAAKQFAVLSAGYDIQLAELPDDAEDALTTEAEEHKEFVEFVFQEMKGGIESKLLGIMDAMTFGFSCSEKVYSLIDFGDFKGKWMLSDLLTRPPEDIEFQIDATGKLTDMGVLQFDLPLPSDKFVIFAYNSKYGNYYGDSDLRAAYRPWWIKEQMLKLMAVSLERYAEPIADISVEGHISDDQRDDLNNFIMNLQSRSGVIHPHNVVLQFLAPPPRSAEAYIPAINLYDQAIRIAILMPGLMGLSGEKETGSLARSQTEEQTFAWVIGQLRKDIELVVNEQIIKPLIDLNFEVEHGMYPRFKFNEVTEEGRHKTFELFLQGVAGGTLQLGPEDQNKMRELIGLEPLPEDFEQVDPSTGYAPGEQPDPEEKMRLEAEIMNQGKPPPGEKDFALDYARQYHGDGSHDDESHGNWADDAAATGSILDALRDLFTFGMPGGRTKIQKAIGAYLGGDDKALDGMPSIKAKIDGALEKLDGIKKR